MTFRDGAQRPRDGRRGGQGVRAVALAALVLAAGRPAAVAQVDPASPPPETARSEEREAPQNIPRPTPPPLADDGDAAEEIVVTGRRPRPEPDWRTLPDVTDLLEEEENDWRRRNPDGSLADPGRIEMGRASIYQDLADRRRYEPFRDEYRDPRPQTSFRFRFGKRQEQP